MEVTEKEIEYLPIDNIVIDDNDIRIKEISHGVFRFSYTDDNDNSNLIIKW